jgi:hypothetical protein
MLLSACAGVVESPDDTSQELREDQGEVELALTTVAPSGKVYRLRYAAFSLSGPQQIRVSTREDLATKNDNNLTTPLLVGQYNVTLEPGWQLLRVAADGSEQGVTAVVTSANPQSLTVTSKQKSVLSFHFRITNGEPVSFGDAQLGIAVDEPTGTLFFTDGPTAWHKSDPDTLTDLRTVSAQSSLVGITSSISNVLTVSSQVSASTVTLSDLDGKVLFAQNYAGVIRDVAMDPVENALYIADEKRDKVTVFDIGRRLPVRTLDTPVPGGLPVIAYDGVNDRLYFAAREVAPTPVMFIENPWLGGRPVQATTSNVPLFDLTVDDAASVFWVSNNAVFRWRANDLDGVKLFETPPSATARCLEADSQSGHVFVGTSGPSSVLTTYTATGTRLAQRPIAINNNLCSISFYPALL